VRISRLSTEGRWPVLGAFLLHVLLATVIFVLIAVPAVGLNLLISWLAVLKVGLWIIYGLTIAEYGLFVVDICLYFWFLWRTALRTADKLW
jgi:hypothetical protein